MLNYKPIDELDERLLHELKVNGLYQEILDLKAAGVSLDALPPSVMGIRLQCQEAADFIEEHGSMSQRHTYRRATRLMIAARHGDVDAVYRSIALDENLEARDKAGYTALIYAAQGGQKSVITALVNAHVNVNTVDKSGNTALHHAIKGGHIDVVETLVQAGVDVTALNNNNETALMQMQPTSENAKVFAFLAAQDYRDLRTKNPAVYQKQRKMIVDWVKKSPENKKLFQQALRQRRNEQSLANTGNPLGTLHLVAHEIKEPALQATRVNTHEKV